MNQPSATEIAVAPPAAGLVIPGTIGDALIEQVRAITDKAEEVSATVNADNFPRAVEIIARLRAARREIDEKHGALTEPAKTALAPINNERTDLFARIDKLDEALEKGILQTWNTARAAGVEESLDREGVLGSKLSIVTKIVRAQRLRVADGSHRADVTREAVAELLGVPVSTLKPIADWIDPKAVTELAANDPNHVVRGFNQSVTEKQHLQTRAKEIVR